MAVDTSYLQSSLELVHFCAPSPLYSRPKSHAAPYAATLFCADCGVAFFNFLFLKPCRLAIST